MELKKTGAALGVLCALAVVVLAPPTATAALPTFGRGRGRRYRISFTGSDGRSGECFGAVTVRVPHSRPGS